MMNPFERLIEVKNDINDFKMPYSVYGNFGKEVMIDKYMKLTNKPTSYLEVRYQRYQW
jgi:hypothetical protein